MTRETRPARDLLSIPYLTVDLDDRWSDPPVIVLPYTTWGDYIGSTVERSNHDAILEDFADEVTSEYLGHGGYRLTVEADGEISEALYEVVVELGQYPLYDENHYSLLECEIESEDWTAWGRAELRDGIVKRVVESYEGDADIEGHVEAHFTDEALDSAYWEAANYGTVLWEREGATGGYFRDLDSLAETLAEDWLRDFERIARGDLPEWRCPGQLSFEETA